MESSISKKVVMQKHFNAWTKRLQLIHVMLKVWLHVVHCMQTMVHWKRLLRTLNLHWKSIQRIRMRASIWAKRWLHWAAIMKMKIARKRLRKHIKIVWPLYHTTKKPKDRWISYGTKVVVRRNKLSIWMTWRCQVNFIFFLSWSENSQWSSFSMDWLLWWRIHRKLSTSLHLTPIPYLLLHTVLGFTLSTCPLQFFP